MRSNVSLLDNKQCLTEGDRPLDTTYAIAGRLQVVGRELLKAKGVTLLILDNYLQHAHESLEFLLHRCVKAQNETSRGPSQKPRY